jgi:TonB family protein
MGLPHFVGSVQDQVLVVQQFTCNSDGTVVYVLALACNSLRLIALGAAGGSGCPQSEEDPFECRATSGFNPDWRREERFLLWLTFDLSGATIIAKPAVARHIVGLHYPQLAHMAGLQGSVVILLTISRDGSVQAGEILSGNGLLASSAAATLKTWKFAPCDQDGGCTYSMNLRFVLRGEPRDISLCEDTFEFDNADQILVTSQFAKAILD